LITCAALWKISLDLFLFHKFSLLLNLICSKMHSVLNFGYSISHFLEVWFFSCRSTFSFSKVSILWTVQVYHLFF
jgi:hypothetical protein